MGACTRHIAAAANGTKASSLGTARVDPTAWCMPSPRARQLGINRLGALPKEGCRLKRRVLEADTGAVDAAERKEILSRYRDYSRKFEEVAARRRPNGNGEVIPFAPLREVGQAPTAREVEVLRLIGDGLANREIGVELFLSEETVKSHVRHILAKLQARSRAHAVAVGFRRGLIT